MGFLFSICLFFRPHLTTVSNALENAQCQRWHDIYTLPVK